MTVQTKVRYRPESLEIDEGEERTRFIPIVLFQDFALIIPYLEKESGCTTDENYILCGSIWTSHHLPFV